MRFIHDRPRRLLFLPRRRCFNSSEEHSDDKTWRTANRNSQQSEDSSKEHRDEKTDLRAELSYQGL